jgi:hypothetical protein
MRRDGRAPAMKARTYLVAAATALLCAAPLSAADPGPYEALRQVDQRLATIAYRLTTANAALCRDTQPVIGAALHASDQYAASEAEAVRAAFSFPVPVAVEAVVPGGPAALAGVRANDGVSAVAGAPVPAPARDAASTSATRDAVQAMIARLPADAPFALGLVQDGRAHVVTVTPRPGCRVEFEVLAGNKLGASSDGHVVQVGALLFERFDDDAIAVVVAHELAHAILRHRERLEAAGVKWGLLAEFGRNGRLFRIAETEADAMGAFLLRNAGYDPQLAVRFWRAEGTTIDGGLFRSRTHPSASARSAAIAAALATMPADAPLPYAPPLLARRDAPIG